MKKYLNILLLFLLVFSISCGDDFQDGYSIPIDEKEFRSVISLGDKEYEVTQIEIKEVQTGVRQATLKLAGTEHPHPLVLHAVLVDMDTANLKLRVLPANMQKVIDKATPSTIIEANKSKYGEVVATINADFFNMTSGESLGAEMVDGVLRTSNQPDWPIIFGFTQDNMPFLNKLAYNAQVTYSLNGVSQKGDVTTITRLNGSRQAEYMVLFDQKFNKLDNSTGTNDQGHEFRLAPASGEKWSDLTNFTEVACKALEQRVYQDQKTLPLDEKTVILSGHGKGHDWMKNRNLEQGIFTIDIKVKYDMYQDEVLLPYCYAGAHSILIQDSQKQPVNEKDEIAMERHPRSGIGYSIDKKKMAMIVVEGRSDESIGVTTAEFADIFAYFRISSAVNLDGGGSSCLILKDEVLNNLTDGAQREVRNVFSFVKEK